MAYLEPLCIDYGAIPSKAAEIDQIVHMCAPYRQAIQLKFLACNLFSTRHPVASALFKQIVESVWGAQIEGQPTWQHA